MRLLCTFGFWVLSTLYGFGQTGILSGQVQSQDQPVEFANILIMGTAHGSITGPDGYFEIKNIPFGEHQIRISFTGYETQTELIVITPQTPNATLNRNLELLSMELDQVVVTGTKTFKRQTESPVIVNVLDKKTLGAVQACNMAEGLAFQPGLRVEKDCQTCNYTQLRMNGLGGGYSQILINSRPIFSPLTGLYGLEQLPANMVDRIEVVRGGGSAIYGSSAIGGTVNILTRIPDENGYDISYHTQNINGAANGHSVSGNANLISTKGNMGAALFFNHSSRKAYDHNLDNFSELPSLKNNAIGTHLFYLPTKNQKLELNLSHIYEYRYGGEMIDQPAHLALQSEERTHHVTMGNLDHQINFNNNNSTWITYLAGQHTARDHYTGILPDSSELTKHLIHPPYGTSATLTLQGGSQLNHRIQKFLGGSNTITIGGEYVVDDVLDEIEAYNYKVDQLTKNAGAFLQSDWEITPSFNLLSGVRADDHNKLDQLVFSPRMALLYKLKNTQLRLSWGQGFRAPQAFDSDLHIAFAGGGVSRIMLGANLKEERSNSISTSLNYDKASAHYIAGFTLEGFYTQLQDAFYLHPMGQDEFGEQFEKRNGSGATVQGITTELRANYDQKVQLEGGITLQVSRYDEPVSYSDELAPKRTFLRSPDQYGYAILTINPSKSWTAAINWVYTGPMELIHLAGAPEQQADEYSLSTPFNEWSCKVTYRVPVHPMKAGFEFFGGVKNITNAYQDDFDSGKNRDSNYIYGPGLPRTIYFGLRLKSL